MGRSAGTGSPVWFRCSKCRSGLNPDRRSGDVSRVRLTGRTRPFRPPRAMGSRSTFVSYQYECLDCGHVGWSNHIDLALKSGLTWEQAREIPQRKAAPAAGR